MHAPLPLAKIGDEYLLFGGAGLISLVAFVALILVPGAQLLRAHLGEGRRRLPLALRARRAGPDRRRDRLAIVYYYNDIAELFG